MDFPVRGRRVHAGVGGRAWQAGEPAVLLLHGAGMDHTIWAQQARGIAHGGRNVLALDLPGHGGSEGPPCRSIEDAADWALAAAAACGFGAFRLAGHSMGALVALEAAGRAGAAVEALALVGFAPEMRVHPDLLAAADAGAHVALEMMVSWGLGMEGMLGANSAPGLSCAGIALRLLERSPAATLAADLACCEAYRGAEAAAAKLTAPTLLLLGADDRMTPTCQAEAFAGRVADARSTILPGVGHLLPIESPATVLTALKAML